MFNWKIVAICLFAMPLWAFAELRDGTGDGEGPAHPSVKYCKDVGGISRIFAFPNWSGAQFGVCVLRDGSMLEEFTLWRHQEKPYQVAITHFRLSSWHSYETPIEQWGEKYCQELGGKILEAIDHDKPSVKYQFCEFSDRSLIEVWTLFSGSGGYPELAKILDKTK